MWFFFLLNNKLRCQHINSKFQTPFHSCFLYISVVTTDTLVLYTVSLYSPPLYLHLGLKREWQPIFSTFCGQKKSKKNFIKAFLYNFIVRLLKYL